MAGVSPAKSNCKGAGNAAAGTAAATENGIIRTADGVADHVHLLIDLRATHCLADVIRELKAVSSGWVHNVLP